jgi:hypothetical protein
MSIKIEYKYVNVFNGSPLQRNDILHRENLQKYIYALYHPVLVFKRLLSGLKSILLTHGEILVQYSKEGKYR